MEIFVKDLEVDKKILYWQCKQENHLSKESDMVCIKSKLLFYLLMIPIFCFGQENEVRYFDANWNEVTSSSFTYYRSIRYNDSGKFTGKITDHFNDGKIQCIIQTDYYILGCGGDPIDCGMRNGEVRWMHKNGNVGKFIRVVNKQIIGIIEFSIEEEVISASGCILGNCGNGSGTYVTSTGEVYEGSFSSGMFHGQGTYTWLDGRKFTGNFVNGQIAGSTTSSEYTMKDVVNTLEAGYWLYKIYKEFNN